MNDRGQSTFTSKNEDRNPKAAIPCKSTCGGGNESQQSLQEHHTEKILPALASCPTAAFAGCSHGLLSGFLSLVTCVC